MTRRFGVLSLIFALVSLVWLGVGVGLAVLAMSDAAPPWVGVVAYIMVLVGFLLVPVTGLLSIVLGIIAIVKDRVSGKVLGGIGILLGLCLASAVVTLVLGSGGLLGAISF